jgi:hypothetical protein
LVAEPVSANRSALGRLRVNREKNRERANLGQPETYRR